MDAKKGRKMNQKETNKKAFCEFVKICCDALEIGEVPPIFVDPKKLKTDTMAACCEYDGKHWRIYIREIPGTVPDPLIFVSMAHDLRQIWQLETDPAEWFDGYKSAAEFEGLDDFFQQKSEVDANGFAMLMLAAVFGLEPQFEPLNDVTFQMIYTRFKELSEEYHKTGTENPDSEK